MEQVHVATSLDVETVLSGGERDLVAAVRTALRVKFVVVKLVRAR